MGEFLSSSDADEALRCVRELRLPHFGHEVVKRAVGLGFDQERGAWWGDGVGGYE